MSEKTRNKNLFKIVLYKTRKVWSKPCLPLYLRNAVGDSSLECGDYNMRLIKRSPNEEKWRVQKKLSNQFIILTINEKGNDVERRKKGMDERRDEMKLFLDDKKKREEDNECELDSLFDDSDDGENANERIEMMANEFVFVDDLKRILTKNRDFILNVLK